MDDSSIIRLIASKFGTYKRNRDEIQVCCPFCIVKRPGYGPDLHYKLYLNIHKHVYNCFRCETKGRLINLFPQIDLLPKQEKVEEVVGDLEPYPNVQFFGELHYPWNELVKECLEDKLWTPEQLWDKVHFCEDYKKNNYSFGPRLVFPINQLGRYRGFQARTIYNNTNPKYISATGMDRRNIIYNFDIAFNYTNMLVITEGFFDCLRIGENAIATLGKQITDDQLRLIRLGDFKKVIVFLDKDAKRESFKNAKKLAPYFKTYVPNVDWESLPLLPNGKQKKDPGDLTKEELHFVLNNRIERVY